jgi:hypothetical protein
LGGRNTFRFLCPAKDLGMYENYSRL